MVEISAKIRLRLAEDFLAMAEKSEKFFKNNVFLIEILFYFNYLVQKKLKKKNS
jgi:hypothetical protein